MKIKLITLSAFSLIATLSWSQTLLYNDGAMIKIQAGATLYVEGGVQNTATGTIDNDGTLEIKGNFLNQGMWEASQPNTLKFSGNTNSDVTSGSALFHDVVIQKDAGSNVVLMDHMTVNNQLNFNAGGASQVVTGNFDVKLGPSATAIGYDSDEYIATTGTGMVQKSVAANGTFEFPVGDGTNYTPVSSTYTGSGYASANIRARVNDLTHPNKPTDATDFISRYWDVNATGITGYSNSLTGTYIPADVNGTASLVKGAVHDGTEWSYAGAAGGTNTVTGTTNDVSADFTGTNFFGKVNLMVFLQGAYNTTTGVMSTTLNTNGLIPLTSPYSDAPATASSIPTGVTDWVKLETRDVSAPAIPVGKASAFIKSDGSIVGLDGVSLPQIKNGNSTSVIAIFHRNHLPIRTPDAGIDIVNPTLYNFSTDLSQAFDSPAITTNDAMINMGNTGVWGLFRGNASGDNSINAVDLAQVRQNSNPSQSNVYLRFDVNLDANVNAVDLAQTRSASNPSKAAHINN